MVFISKTNNTTMITQKVNIEGVDYEVTAATYKMLQESVEQLHLSVASYHAHVKKADIAPEVQVALAPKPVPTRRKKK
jgi:hypothetical protein